MKKIKKSIISVAAIASTAAVVAPLTTCINYVSENLNNLSTSNKWNFKFTEVKYVGLCYDLQAKMTKENINVYGETVYDGTVVNSDEPILLNLGVDYDLWYVENGECTFITDIVLNDGFRMDKAGTWKFEAHSKLDAFEIMKFNVEIVEQHPVKPFDDQWFGAEVSNNGMTTHYKTAKEAFEAVNSDESKKCHNVTFTLFEDWIADENGDFISQYDGVIRPSDRADRNYTLTINLNGFTIDGNRKGKKPIEHGVMELRENGNFIVKNGIITGGKTYTNGGGIFFDDNDCKATLQNLLITGNETIDGKEDHNNGGGLYIKNCDGTITLKDVTITDNKASGYGGGVYMKSQGTSDLQVNLVGKVKIVNNHAANYRDNFTMQYKDLSNDYEFEWPNLKDVSLESEIRINYSNMNTSSQFVDGERYGGEKPVVDWLMDMEKIFFADNPRQGIHIGESGLGWGVDGLEFYDK